MAVTRREQQILDLDRAGLSARDIAEHLGVKLGTVRRALRGLSDNTWADRQRDARTIRGSALLLTAVLAAGGHR